MNTFQFQSKKKKISRWDGIILNGNISVSKPRCPFRWICGYMIRCRLNDFERGTLSLCIVSGFRRRDDAASYLNDVGSSLVFRVPKRIKYQWTKKVVAIPKKKSAKKYRTTDKMLLKMFRIIKNDRLIEFKVERFEYETKYYPNFWWEINR